MFKKKYDSIMKTFVKAKTELEALIEQNQNEHRKLEEQKKELEIKQDVVFSESTKARKSLEKINEIV